MCSEYVWTRHNTLEYNVSMRRVWLYACVGYCNSPLNNKNIDYHFLWFFPTLGLHINHCFNCVIVRVLCLVWFSQIYALFFFHSLTGSGSHPHPFLGHIMEDCWINEWGYSKLYENNDGLRNWSFCMNVIWYSKIVFLSFLNILKLKLETLLFKVGELHQTFLSLDYVNGVKLKGDP